MSAAKERLTHIDLESELNDAVNMAEVACELIENAGAARNGGIIVTEHEWKLLVFAVFHSSNLANALKKRFEQIAESQRGRAS